MFDPEKFREALKQMIEAQLNEAKDPAARITLEKELKKILDRFQKDDQMWKKIKESLSK